MVLTPPANSRHRGGSPWRARAPQHWAQVHTHPLASPFNSVQRRTEGCVPGSGVSRVAKPPTPVCANSTPGRRPTVRPERNRISSESTLAWQVRGAAGPRLPAAALRDQKKARDSGAEGRGPPAHHRAGAGARRGEVSSSEQPTSGTAGLPGCEQSSPPRRRPPQAAG